MSGSTQTPNRVSDSLASLNGPFHRTGLKTFAVIVIAHWAEHIVQAVQIYILGWPLPEARGVLGIPFPWLVTSEWMHYGYALIMLTGFLLLKPGFTGTPRTWWNIALGIQIWHHLEHLLLLLQALTGTHLAGNATPTSILQLAIPRVELHLFYNALVTLPMLIAMITHSRPHTHTPHTRCHCATTT